MKKINKDEMIDVYNYFDHTIYIPSSFDAAGYVFDKVSEEGEPSITPVRFSDIQTTNRKSPIFKNGILRFEEELEEDIYKTLGIIPERNVNYLTKDDMLDIILDPCEESYEKIISVNSKYMIEKLKAILTKLLNDNEYDISTNVVDYIDARMEEINRGDLKSSLTIKRSKKVTPKRPKGKVEEVGETDEIEEVQEKPKNNKGKGKTSK